VHRSSYQYVRWLGGPSVEDNSDTCLGNSMCSSTAEAADRILTEENRKSIEGLEVRSADGMLDDKAPGAMSANNEMTEVSPVPSAFSSPSKASMQLAVEHATDQPVDDAACDVPTAPKAIDFWSEMQARARRDQLACMGAVGGAPDCDQEECDDLNMGLMKADPLFLAGILRYIHGQSYKGFIERIEVGVRSMQHLYRVRYEDGDIEHLSHAEALQARRDRQAQEPCANRRWIRAPL